MPIFLSKIRKDYDKAEQLYQRAMNANPNNANTLGNFAGFLLSLGKNKEGYSLLDKAISFLPVADVPGLAAELWFYAFCYWPDDKRKDALKNLKRVLLGGDCSPEWG